MVIAASHRTSQLLNFVSGLPQLESLEHYQTVVCVSFWATVAHGLSCLAVSIRAAPAPWTETAAQLLFGLSYKELHSVMQPPSWSSVYRTKSTIVPHMCYHF